MIDISLEEFQNSAESYMDKACNDLEVIRMAVHKDKNVIMLSEDLYNRLKVPDSINADLMIADELHAKLQSGYDDIQAGRIVDAATVFEKTPVDWDSFVIPSERGKHVDEYMKEMRKDRKIK